MKAIVHTPGRVMPADTLVVGVGNPLLGDDGLGVHVARALLRRRDEWPPRLGVLEAGTSLFEFASELAEPKLVLLVDALELGQPPGVRAILELCPLPSPWNPTRWGWWSLHQWGVLDTLAALEVMGRAPRAVTVVGAQPASLAPALTLSPVLARVADQLVAEILSGSIPRASLARHAVA